MVEYSEPAAQANLQTPTPTPRESHNLSPAQILSGSPAPFSLRSNINNGDDITRYLGATHWKELIQTIQKAQDSSLGLGVTEKAADYMGEESHSEGPSMILNAQVKPLSLHEALDALPSQQTMERLLAIYFSKKLMVAPYLHKIKFQREIESLRSNPSSTSLLWLSMLYSILFISWKSTPDGEYLSNLLSTDNHPSSFLKSAAQCLVAGNYLKMQPYAIEALLMYCSACYIQSGKVDAGVWALFSLVTRQAQRMGYHRDPRHLSKKISSFEAEMRRRVWYWIEGCDVVYSYQLGMPCIVHEEECDIDIPNSIEDENFDEDCHALPTPTSNRIPGIMEFYHHKAAQIRLFRRVARLVLSTKPPDHDAIRRLDQDLRRLREQIPDGLKWRPITYSSFSDPSYVIMFRVVIEQLHLRCICILHRIYLTYQRDNAQFDSQRAACVSAAMEILDQQACVETERQLFGRLHQETYMCERNATHTFLFAAMVVCLELSLSKPTMSNLAERDTKIQALETSHNILSSSKLPYDHGHAAKVLGAILTRTKRGEYQNGATLNPPSMESPIELTGQDDSTGPQMVLDPTQLSHDDQSLMSNVLTQQVTPESFEDYLQPMDNLLNMPYTYDGGIDWSSIDQYLFFPEQEAR